MKKLFTERHGMHEPRVKDEGATPRGLALRVEVRWRTTYGADPLVRSRPSGRLVRLWGGLILQVKQRVRCAA